VLPRRGRLRLSGRTEPAGPGERSPEVAVKSFRIGLCTLPDARGDACANGRRPVVARCTAQPFTGDGVRQVTGERLRGTPGNQSAPSRERNVQAMGGRGYALAARRGAMLASPPSGSQTVWREIPDKFPGNSLKDVSDSATDGCPFGAFLRMESCGALWHVQRRLPG